MGSISHAIELWLSVWRCVAVRRCIGPKIDVSGGSQQMPPEYQHGGYSHPTSHSTSSDLGASLHTSWTESMAILTCVGPREQVLVSTSLPPSSRIPPRSRLDLAVWLLQVTGLFSGRKRQVTQPIGWKDRSWVYLGRTFKLWLRV